MFNFLLFTVLHLHSPGIAADTPHLNEIYLMSIRGTINPGVADYLKSSIQKAEVAQASALIVELDTPGGLVSSVRQMAQAIDQSSVPVVVFTTPSGASATSAGALLSLASHLSAMAPGTNIGAAHPVDSSGKDVGGAMGDKVLNDTVAFAQGLAEQRGRNREWAKEIVSKSKSFTYQQAQSERIVELIANDLSDLLTKANGREIKLKDQKTIKLKTAGASIHRVEMTWGQKILDLLANPNIATMLMSAAVLCLYLEINNPGLILPGVLGVTALLVSFVSFQMLPIRTGGLLLLMSGIVMLLAEIFVTSHGVLAVGGVVSFVLGALWLFDPSQSAIHVSGWVIVPIAAILGLGVFLLLWFASRSISLREKLYKTIGGNADFGLRGYSGTIQKDGKVLIRGETWNYESSDSLKVGDSVEVVDVRGLVVQVRIKGKGNYV